MQYLTAVFVAVILFTAPAMAQETQQADTVWSAPIPVWIAVRDIADDPGAHRVLIQVTWADSEHKDFRFAKDVEAGDFVIRLPKKESDGEQDLANGCVFKSNWMAHGSTGASPAAREDNNCLALLAANMPLIGLSHRGSPMVCTQGTRNDSESKSWIRYYGCYWAKPPESS